MLFEIGRFSLFVATGLSAVLCIAVLVSILRRGPSGIADLDRNRVDVQNWAKGRIPDHREKTSIDVIEGIEIKANKKNLTWARQTRGIAAEY